MLIGEYEHSLDAKGRLIMPAKLREDIGEKFVIHSYKHDGNIHRSWDEAVLLEIHDDYLIFGNEKTKVTESDGRTWRTKEPSVLYFFNNSGNENM